MSKQAGRPTKFNHEIATRICDAIVDGKTIKEICGRNGIPSASTVFRWLAKDEHDEFRELYARAREAQAERLADEILRIADDGTNDFITRQTSSGAIRNINSEHIQRSKLRIETRKWLLSKLLPKKYGPRPDCLDMSSPFADILKQFR